MFFSRPPTDAKLSLEGQALKQYRNFKYLGIVFYDQNDPESEITNQIYKFDNNLFLLYPLLKHRNIPSKVKKTLIYITILKPILTYSHESWTLISKTISQLQESEMKVMRLI